MAEDFCTVLFVDKFAEVSSFKTLRQYDTYYYQNKPQFL